MSDAPWLVVGLGNPGPGYARNRHNVGAMVVAELADRLGGRFSAHKARAQVLEGRLAPVGGVPGRRLVLAVPASWMNESGGPVAGLVSYYRVPLHQVLVVHDELDLDLGVVRVKRGGGEGGHNGLRSISRSLGSRDYPRLRVGIGRPPGRMDPADYVLKDFPGAQRADVDLLLVDAADAVEAVVATESSTQSND